MLARASLPPKSFEVCAREYAQRISNLGLLVPELASVWPIMIYQRRSDTSLSAPTRERCRLSNPFWVRSSDGHYRNCLFRYRREHRLVDVGLSRNLLPFAAMTRFASRDMGL